MAVDLHKHVQTVTAHKTNDSDMGSPAGEPATLTVDEIVVYLEQDPRHAIVVTAYVEEDGGDANTVPGRKVAVFRGASDRIDGFYTQTFPLDEPDADGGDWTAAEALSAALDSLYD